MGKKDIINYHFTTVFDWIFPNPTQLCAKKFDCISDSSNIWKITDWNRNGMYLHARACKLQMSAVS